MATPSDNTVPLTGDPLKDGLLQGSSWQFGGGSHVLTYSLSLNDSSNGGPWTAALTAAIQSALAAWSNVADLTFVEAGSGKPFFRSTADLAITLTGNDLGNAFPGLLGLGLSPSPREGDAIYPGTVDPATGAAEQPYTRATWPKPEGDIFLD